MIELSSTQKKALEIYHNEGHIKAWNYWKLMGNTYGIFLGEVPSHEFIDGESLANHIGLTEGVLFNTDTPWLKFILDGNIIYVPMKPLMHSVSWDAINVCGAVYENEGATIDIGNNTYDITSLRGLNKNHKHLEYYGYDIPETHQSEWNKLLYPIHSAVFKDSHNPTSPSVPYARWATYSDDDLIVDHRSGVGSYSWSQETPHSDETRRMVRGNVGITGVSSLSSTLIGVVRGWRPALRVKTI